MDKWPKNIPVLSDKQVIIKKDFMKTWLEFLPKKFSIIENFNHKYSIKNSNIKSGRFLELGAGLGEHINYENLSGVDYYALELLPELAEKIKVRFPNVKVIVGDCQKKIDFADNFFDKVLAINVLEHLPNLPATLDEIYRLIRKDGELCVVIPCEGGLAYSLARKISAERLFKKKYKMSYDWYVKSDHVNLSSEIFEELEKRFEIKHKHFFPLFIPLTFANLMIGLILSPKK